MAFAASWGLCAAIAVLFLLLLLKTKPSFDEAVTVPMRIVTCLLALINLTMSLLAQTALFTSYT